jgi:magnesium transporter
MSVQPEVLDHLDSPLSEHFLHNFLALNIRFTAEETIEFLRHNQDIPDINYLYVVDDDNRLVGVLPTRKLLHAAPDARIADIMQPDPVSIPAGVSVLQAVQLFMEYKFLAYPVVDKERHLVGVVDVTLFNRELLDVAKRRQIEDLFETLGVRIAKLAQASPLAAFRYRFPWLLATIASGSLCAVIADVYGETLQRSIVIAFFLTLVLGLAEGMSVQAMSVTIQGLHAEKLSWRMFARNLKREGSAGLLLGVASGALVTLIVGVWYQSFPPALVVGSSVAWCMTIANLLGLIVPTSLHALKLNFRIAAGPLTLAITDLITLASYFTIARLSLG